MIDCANVRIREALPEYIHGQLDIRQRLLVQAHLAGCDACSAELAVLERCRAVMAATPAVDTARILAALPAPRSGHGRLDPSQLPASAATLHIGGGRPALWQRRAWRAAAAVLLMVGAAGVLVMRGGQWPTSERAFRGGSVAAGGASGAGDSSLLASSDVGQAPRAPLSLGGGLSDLSDAALSALLNEVDDVEALPLEEPAPVATFMVTDLSGAD